MLKKRVYAMAFKKMAVALLEAKGSVKEAAIELGIDSSRISKWKNQYNSNGNSNLSAIPLSNEQKELREAESRRVIF